MKCLRCRGRDAKQAKQEVPEEEPMELGDPYDTMIPSAGDADAVHTRGYELGGESLGAPETLPSGDGDTTKPGYYFNGVRHDSMEAVNAALNSGAAPAAYTRVRARRRESWGARDASFRRR